MVILEAGRGENVEATFRNLNCHEFVVPTRGTFRDVLLIPNMMVHD